MPDKRVTYRRRHSYRTKSNTIKLKMTPGGQNAVHYLKKRGQGPKCGDCKKALIGVRAAPLIALEMQRWAVG